MWWKCKECGEEWESTVDNRTRGTGCPICARSKRGDTKIKKKILLKGSLLDNHPEIAKEWNYEKNKNLKPEEFLSTSNKVVWWKCQNEHEWETSIAYRTKYNSRCPICRKN